MEGVERYKVKLLPHNQLWKEEFIELRDKFENVLYDTVIDIQHVGSTAIPTVWAKPILDVAILTKRFGYIEIEKIKKLGYDYCGVNDNNPNYHLFVLRGENNISLHHIHCYDKVGSGFEQLVGFRDYLNENENIAIQYSELKKVLFEKYKDDRQQYTKAKADFIQSIYEKIVI